jgi:DNA-binding response OmpR family regulator
MPKILIVDDESYIRLLLEQTLEEFEERGVEIITAENGKQAVDTIVKEKPELVFLDIMLPEINGFEVCSKIKNEYRLMNVYIIMLTAKGQENDEKRGLEVGVNRYLTKPFNPDLIVSIASEVLNIKI